MIWFEYNGKTFEPNSETEYGEPQLWLYLSDGTSIEITYEQEGLPEEEYHFYVRHHCSDKDFDNDVYHGTCGVIDQAFFDELCCVQECLKITLAALSSASVVLDLEEGV